jgi:hypothetical protein
LVKVAHQRVGFLAEDAHDRFACEAGFRGHDALLYSDLCTRKKEAARSEWGVKDWFLQLQGEDVPSGKM